MSTSSLVRPKARDTSPRVVEAEHDPRGLVLALLFAVVFWVIIVLLVLVVV